nr:helix-turn-helix domain-containing protein [Streptomyces sp. NRRL F-4489]
MDPRQRLTPKQKVQVRDALKRHYDAGASFPILVGATGRSRDFVHRMLLAAGVQLRRGRRSEEMQRGYAEALERSAAARSKQRQSVEGISP